MRAAILFASLGVVACAHPAVRPVEHASPRATRALEPSDDAPPSAKEARLVSPGVGTVKGRAPGTSRTVDTVRLSAHRVSASVRGALARVEIEEDLTNDGEETLEGQYQIDLPAGASLSRLALWVDGKLVEGAMVERQRAHSIYREIVDDPFKPRDPALADRDGSRVSLRVFPIAPHDKRTVLVAYDVVVREYEGKARVSIPMPAPGDALVDEATLEVRVRGAKTDEIGFGPYRSVIEDVDGESVLRANALPVRGDAQITMPAASAAVRLDGFTRGKNGWFMLRLATPEAPPSAAAETAIVLDRAMAQTPEGFREGAELAIALLARVTGSFVVLACDAACDSFPTAGTRAATPGAIAEAAAWLRSLAARGTSSFVTAVEDGAARLGPGGQLVYVGGATSTSGPLRDESAVAALRGAVRGGRIDVRIVGTGPRFDEAHTSTIARAGGALLEPMPDARGATARAAKLAAALRRPVVDRITLTLPPGMSDVFPALPQRARAGEPLVVFGRWDGAAGGKVRLDGTLDGKAVSVVGTAQPRDTSPNGVLPRLWAEAKIVALEGKAGAEREVIALSKEHHVASKYTSLLVLENEAMFKSYGLAPRDDVASGWGAGGLGLSGAGEGAGARGNLWGDGAGGVGSVGNVGRGAGASGVAGGASGLGGGRVAGGHAARAPALRVASVQVSGRIPPEIIQRIVRNAFGRFRVCYEIGLRRDPSLRGRVAVRFLIDRQGSVPAAVDAGSDLGDAEVVSCVARAFTSLAFPAPEGGTITVVYPILFSNDPNDATPPQSLPLTRPYSTGARFVGVEHAIASDADLGHASDSILASLPDPTTRARAADAAVDAAPQAYAPRIEAARAFEMDGDERRACAHWRSLADRSPWGGEVLYQAVRCRARAGDVPGAVALADGIGRLDERVERLLQSLEVGGSAPAYEAAATGELEARLVCAPAAARCPEVAVVGGYASPHLRAATGAPNAIVPTLYPGRYHTIVVGAAAGVAATLTLKTATGTRAIPITTREGTHVVAVTRVE